MATNVSPTRTELINTLTQIIHSLQHYPENDTISLLNTIQPFFRLALQTIANTPKELPKELQWCRKVQAIAALEESSTPKSTEDTSASVDGSLISNAVSKNVSVAEDESTAPKPAEESSARFSVDSSSITEDTSAAADESLISVAISQNTSVDEEETTTLQESTSTMEESPAETTPTPLSALSPERTQISNKRIPYLSLEDELIAELIKKASTFKLWTSDPDLFWQQTAHPLQLLGSTLDERLKAFYEHAAGQESEVEILNFIRRFDSVIAYLEYKRRFPWAYSVSHARVAEFLEQIQVAREQTNKYREFLLCGRRRLLFCHLLSKDQVDFKGFSHNDTRFDDIDYGVLFLGLDDRM